MRLIDADKLKERIRLSTLHWSDLWKRVVGDIIDNQDTIEILQWIPVEERLPNKEECQKCNSLFIVSDGNRTYSTYFDILDTFRFGEPTTERFRIDKCIIAWQPLPKPYKKGENS